jgi:hypothetical protein
MSLTVTIDIVTVKLRHHRIAMHPILFSTYTTSVVNGDMFSVLHFFLPFVCSCNLVVRVKDRNLGPIE